MNQQFALELFCYGGVIPLAAACTIAVAVRRFLPRSVAKRYSLSLGAGVAFFVGYALLPESSRAFLAPSRYWHWLPHLALVSMIVGAMAQARGLLVIERWIGYAMFATLAAVLLVPTWETLNPPRVTYIPILACYLLALMVFVDPLTTRISPRLFIGVLWFVAACLTAMVWATLSETFGRLGAVAASVWAGIWFATCLGVASGAVRALTPVYAILIGGTAFVAFVYPPHHVEYALVLVPAAPLALWVAAVGPLSRLEGKRAVGAQIGCVCIVLLVAAALLILGEESDDSLAGSIMNHQLVPSSLSKFVIARETVE